MFNGSFDNQIDGKNRMIIPARFRDELGGGCMLTRGFDACLTIYTCKVWEEEQSRLIRLPKGDPEARAYLRYVSGNATYCDIDKQGRILIPQRWIDMAGITKELITIGMIDRIEVWAKEVYENDENGAKLTPEGFRNVSRNYQV